MATGRENGLQGLVGCYRKGEGQRCSPQVKQGFITMCFEGTSHGVVKEPIARDRKTEGKGGIA